MRAVFRVGVPLCVQVYRQCDNAHTRTRTPTQHLYACCRSQDYEVDGSVYRRMRFYVHGANGEGTVHVEVKMDGSKPEYRYLFVEIPGK